ncbi:valacyclovir hydrolase isoform X2 [Pogonomyrmex barbatus]|uniref:Valacyclovir hydrolase isoform X2 n=1 Tax=Pogonomyrmex barbatus TaxID=144034 RepID=A0A8N1S5W1_9HYME|nr:valacyclovir hydrolase isoform X2 [Pogonomyrmex barbatus]
MWINTCKMYARFTNVLCKVIKSENRSLRIRQLSAVASKAHEVEERKIKVDGMEINYARVGTGDHPVLLLPGALGTIWTDFKPQIENLDRNKLTIVAWDPPGYGKSRPPNRTFPDDFFQRDATWAHNLMKTLGYTKFSLVGWSDGGITSLLLASTYPDSIRKMIVLGANAYIHPDEIKIYENYFQKTWSNWIDSVLRLYKTQNGDLCKQILSKIKCPTLIIHGAKDAMVLPEHPTYLKENIANSKVHIFEKGAHNLHLRYPEEFNNLVTNFLLDQSKL